MATVEGEPRALRVCLVAPVSPPYGGMSVQAQLLARRLRDEGVDVHVLATNPVPPTGLAWVKSVPGVRTLLREVCFCVHLLPAVRRADVVHHLAASSLYFLLHSAPVILASRLSGTRIVLNYRGGNAPGFLRRYHRLLVPLIRLADAVVVPSGFLARVFRQHGIEVTVLPNVADIEGFAFEPRVRLQPRLIVTRALEPMYNVEGVLRAFRRVQQHYPEAALGIVGAGSQAGYLSDLVAEWKLRVRFYGCVPHAQLPALYREYDVCINASLVDNFPGSLVEAACCGLPIVTSDAGGIPDMIRHQNTGMLCRVNDDVQLADWVIELLRGPELALQMARNARRWAEQFAWTRVAPQLLGVYRAPGVDGQAQDRVSGGVSSRFIRAGLAGAQARLARHVVFPLHERAKRHVTARMLRDMEAEQWLPVAELQERQAARLRALVTHAADTVRYYRRRFRESGLQPQYIQGREDLPKIPLLSKDDIRNSLEEMRSGKASRVVRCTTGGSSGEPLAFYLGPTRVSSDVAARCRAERWWGLGVGELEFVLWASPIEIGKQDRLRAARDHLLRTRLFSAFEMTPQTMDRYIEHLLRTPYRRVFGYPGALALLCDRAAATGQPLQGVGVRGVFVTGEYLRDEWRALISSGFGCPVANGYGGRESGFIAHECPAGRMHITADRLIVEVVDEAGNVLAPGESGEIVVTHLDTPEMPLLRYRTGDIGALAADACPCGRTLPVLARVDGRKTDFVVAPDGSLLHGLFVTHILRDIEGIRHFRVTQTSVDRFDVEIVPAENFSKRSEARISEGLSRRLRAAVAVTFMYRGTIPAGPSGKFRPVICAIADGARPQR